jgi:metal-responsive CopG/Arc/MetJ family transcriptional regulator
MKTIAVTIDETTLQLLDELAEASPQHQSRSALVRVAIREFAAQARRRESEAREHKILHKHRKRLAQQTRALIGEQARP